MVLKDNLILLTDKDNLILSTNNDKDNYRLVKIILIIDR